MDGNDGTNVPDNDTGTDTITIWSCCDYTESITVDNDRILVPKNTSSKSTVYGNDNNYFLFQGSETETSTTVH
jgi:hypothetical protein